MDELVWGSVISAVAVLAAGLLVWRIAGACWLTQVGAIGTVVGGALAILPVFLVPDPDLALRLSFALTILAAAWLLGWVLASGINMRRLNRIQAAAALGVAKSAAATSSSPALVSVGVPQTVGATQSAAPTA